jgi:aminomethyltransferase
VPDLKRTPLYEAHRALGARMVPFGGWEMPVQYTGILEEHKAVRESAGIFDVCHMGEIVFRGPRAQEAVQRLVTNDLGKLTDGKALYTVMCYPDGGIVDDCIVYRRGAEDLLVVVNASNIDKDFAWMREQAGGISMPVDESAAWGLIAVQGPNAPMIVARAAGQPLDETIKPFHFAKATIANVPVTCARTGYTGEDGFEIFVAADQARTVWDALLRLNAKPAGLGARDTLRLEARLSLYGNDIDRTTNPIEAGLGWVVKGRGYVGEDAVEKMRQAGPSRKLVGFVVKGRGIARHDYPILDREGGEVIGKVTSGTTAPTLGVAVGMGYVPARFAEPGTMLAVDCRGKIAPVEVVSGPFYKRKR